MSHITRIRTRMVQKAYILAALKELGYDVEENCSVRGFLLKQTPVDIKVSTGKGGYDIGLNKQADGYEIVADWWGVRGIRSADFAHQVAQRYAYHAVRTQLEEKGFSLVSENVDKDNSVRLVLRRIA